MRKLAFLILALGLTSCNQEKNTETSEPGMAAVLNSSETPQAAGYEVGDLATDFNLKNVDGKRLSLADYKDAKGFILTFTCNQCPFSKAYEDRLNALDKKYSPKGFPVIAINPSNPAKDSSESFEKMQERAREKAFSFPYLVDEGQRIYPQYGATNTPHMYVLKKTPEGNEVAYIGAVDDNSRNASGVTKRYVEDAVDALLAGKSPEVTKTKAIGCTIK